MEKFGIFNLLSSLFAAQSGTGGANPAEKSAENSAENQGKLLPFRTVDLDNAAAEKRATVAPLKNSMLATMKNHDEFVKRVRAQNKR